VKKRFLVIAVATTMASIPAVSVSAERGPLRPCTGVTVDPPTEVLLGKSTVLSLNAPVARMVIGGLPSVRSGRPVELSEEAPGPMGAMPSMVPRSDGVADVDVILLSPTELFFLGKRAGSMNVLLQGVDGRCTIKDLVLSGVVSNSIQLDQVLSLASSYGDGKKVINLLRVSAQQQVMLEVKIAEVSKKLLDKFGIDYTRIYTAANGVSSGIVSGIIGGGPAVLGRFGPNLNGTFAAGSLLGGAAGSVTGGSAAASAKLGITGNGASLLGIDAQNRDGLVRVLAEPNIMAISGQQASFLSGGKIFIPVSQSNANGIPVVTLEEKEFGIGVKFTPTVLDGTRVNLKVISEVSELSQTGSPFSTVNGVVSVLPSFLVRRADTTVQLSDGQSFVVAGLIKNNLTESVQRFPGLGEIPVLGALFRSTEFQKDQTELVFVITPRLVKPLSEVPRLPTDNHIEPKRSEVFLKGSLEGNAPAAAPVIKAVPGPQSTESK
jgi:pilus assembly protein CpaC